MQKCRRTCVCPVRMQRVVTLLGSFVFFSAVNCIERVYERGDFNALEIYGIGSTVWQQDTHW